MATIDYWSNLTGPELQTLAARDPVALLPVAAIEQHGPHLPLNTDVTIGNGIVDAALAGLTDCDRAAIVVLPGVAPGASLEHTRFAGTLSLSAEMLIGQLCAIGAGVARTGIRRLVLFNSHGGNRAALDIAALQLRSRYDLLAVKANYFRFAPPAGVLYPEELAHGLHGGALETSMMLHLAPGAVRRDQLADNESLGARRAAAGYTLGPEGDAGFAWCAADLHPAGVTGNAAAADADAGRRLVAGYAARLTDILREAAAFDMTVFSLPG